MNLFSLPGCEIYGNMKAGLQGVSERWEVVYFHGGKRE